MTEIPLIEPVVGEEELENIRAVLDSGYMTQGPFGAEFEDEFEEMTGADHAITATSCTTGMDLALEAVGVGPGDEVVVPDFTHPATANVVVRRGATPVLVDVERNTYNIDPTATADAVSDDTAALLPVSWGGQPLDPEPFRAIADEHDLPIVEDAACSAGAAFDGDPVGSQFDASVFSFHPRKVLTTGEGGMITTDDDDLDREMRSAKNFGTDPSGDHPGFRRANATNYRLSDVLGAIGLAQMEKRDQILDRRAEIAETYTDLLEDVEGIDAPHVPADADHVYQSYCVYLEVGDDQLRDDVIEAMAEEDIETQIGTHALHRTDAFADAARVGSLDTSAALADNLLTLPIAHSMTDEDCHRVIETLTDIVTTKTA